MTLREFLELEALLLSLNTKALSKDEYFGYLQTLGFIRLGITLLREVKVPDVKQTRHRRVGRPPARQQKRTRTNKR